MIWLLLVLLAQTPTPSGLTAAWDYPDATLYTVTAFEVRLDSAPAYTDIGVPPSAVLPSTGPGAHTFTWALPSFDPGTSHSFAVRACNTAGCSAPLSVTFDAPTVGPGYLLIVR